MAFTTPKTWSFGEILTSTDMNTYVRDNTQGLFDRDRVLQVVQTVKTDTFSTASSTFVTITGLEVTITPSVATHKVLLVATVNFSDSGTAAGTHFRFTGGNATDFVGDSAGSRTRSATGDDTNGTTSVNMPQRVIVYVDSPATTSPVTYGVQMLNTSSSSTFVNRSRDDSDSARRTRGASSIVAIEVAA